MEGVWIILCIGAGVSAIIAWAKIFEKAGYSQWYALIMIVPIFNLVVFFWFAFVRWPISVSLGKDKQAKEK